MHQLDVLQQEKDVASKGEASPEFTEKLNETVQQNETLQKKIAELNKELNRTMKENEDNLKENDRCLVRLYKKITMSFFSYFKGLVFRNHGVVNGLLKEYAFHFAFYSVGKTQGTRNINQ